MESTEGGCKKVLLWTNGVILVRPRLHAYVYKLASVGR